jgi:predicted phosphoadenosine phosphosulfate sulfurtransferase
MRIYKPESVYEAALNRIRYIFDEFPHVIVSMSGGKDSTTVFEMAMIVAKEKNRLPLEVAWLDQELEFEATAEYVKNMMYRPDVKPIWIQAPFNLVNATSGGDNYYTMAWGEGVEWVREKDPISIKENTWGADRFYDMFPAILNWLYPKQKACYLTGLRAEENPARAVGATNAATYKWVTWGKMSNKKYDQYTFHPIYDWSYRDVWKAIHDNNWDYNKHYDAMYQYGVPVTKMRVSNYHHEAAVHAIFYLQEIEPKTYEKATQRLSGIDSAGKAGAKDYFVKELPFMFKDWSEYRDYLLENLITSENLRERFAKRFREMDALYAGEVSQEAMCRVQISSLLTSDEDMVKMDNWERAPEQYNLRRKIKGQTFFEGKKKPKKK